MLRVPDPNFFHPGSWICIKEFKYFYLRKLFLSFRKNDPGSSSRIRILIFYPSRIPDHGGQKGTGSRIPDPQHCFCKRSSFKWSFGKIILFLISGFEFFCKYGSLPWLKTWSTVQYLYFLTFIFNAWKYQKLMFEVNCLIIVCRADGFVIDDLLFCCKTSHIFVAKKCIPEQNNVL